MSYHTYMEEISKEIRLQNTDSYRYGIQVLMNNA